MSERQVSAAVKVPRLLAIAGSDSGGGAGIQADIKTSAAFDVFATSAITAVTVQNTLGVNAVHPVPPDIVRAQVHAVLSDIGADVIKIGMLGDVATLEAVADALQGIKIPIVVDPVMVSTSGSQLLADAAVEALKDRVLPMATVVTPNLPEARVLAHLPDATLQELLDWAKAYAVAADTNILLKGGHGESAQIDDYLVTPSHIRSYTAKRIDTPHTHGTGCTLSAAIACGLALGQSLEVAVQHAHAFVHRAIATAPGLGQGHGPLNFFTN